MKKLLAYPLAALYISFPALWAVVKISQLTKEK